MNWMIVPTLIVAALLGVAGYRWGRRRPHWWALLVAALLGMPALAYAGYYLHLVDEPMALYTLRAAKWSEVLASGIGLGAGMIAGRIQSRGSRGRLLAMLATTAVAAAILVAPYVKPIVHPANWSAFTNKRDGIAVMQSTPYSCGPATAATLLCAKGDQVTEMQLARDAFTSSSGTENWYLARAIRERRHDAEFRWSSTILESSIAGVRGAGYGHYIAVISHDASGYWIADPLIGPRHVSAAELNRRYQFTGFYLVIE